MMNIKHQTALLTALLLASPLAMAQGAQYSAEDGPFVLTDCRIETITNGVIENGSVAIDADGNEAFGYRGNDFADRRRCSAR